MLKTGKVSYVNKMNRWHSQLLMRFCLSLIYRLLQKARLRCNNAVVIRDSLRNEESKQTKNDEENREKREQLVSSTLNFTIL